MSGGLESSRDLRASHQDRDEAVDRLRIAAGDGRLAPEELDERIERALSARTQGELEVLLSDLPDVPSAPGAAPAPAAKDLVRLKADMGNVERTGSWVVPRRLEAEARMGTVVLDFTHATVTEPELDLEVAVSGGVLTLIVPPDVDVQVDDVSVQAGNVHRRRGARRAPDTPVRLLINVSGTVSMGNVVVRGPRRTFLEWLLRRPAAPRH